MAKLSDYELRKLGQQLIDFKDDIRDLCNFGKYQFPITVDAVPGWKTNDGEMCFFTATAVTDRRIYVRLGGFRLGCALVRCKLGPQSGDVFLSGHGDGVCSQMNHGGTAVVRKLDVLNGEKVDERGRSPRQWQELRVHATVFDSYRCSSIAEILR